jgi:hypothetical protein
MHSRLPGRKPRFPVPERGDTVNKVVIYRLDDGGKKDVPIGTIVERRKTERGDNLIGLMRVARKTFEPVPKSNGRYCIKLLGARIAF